MSSVAPGFALKLYFWLRVLQQLVGLTCLCPERSMNSSHHPRVCHHRRYNSFHHHRYHPHHCHCYLSGPHGGRSLKKLLSRGASVPPSPQHQAAYLTTLCSPKVRSGQFRVGSQAYRQAASACLSCSSRPGHGRAISSKVRDNGPAMGWPLLPPPSFRPSL